MNTKGTHLIPGATGIPNGSWDSDGIVSGQNTILGEISACSTWKASVILSCSIWELWRSSRLGNSFKIITWLSVVPCNFPIHLPVILKGREQGRASLGTWDSRFACNSGLLSSTSGWPWPPRFPDQTIPTWTIAWACQARPSAITEVRVEPKPIVIATFLTKRQWAPSPPSRSWTGKRLILPREQPMPFLIAPEGTNPWVFGKAAWAWCLCCLLYSIPVFQPLQPALGIQIPYVAFHTSALCSCHLGCLWKFSCLS